MQPLVPLNEKSSVIPSSAAAALTVKNEIIAAQASEGFKTEPQQQSILYSYNLGLPSSGWLRLMFRCAKLT